MTKIIKAIVPPTKEQGSCAILGMRSAYETFKQNILWQYNKLREHDGLPPVWRMPSGTKYQVKSYWGGVL